MPNIFKSIGNKLNTTSETSVYTVPNATTALIKSVYAANINETNAVNFDVYITKSGSADDFYIIKEAIVPIKSTLQAITETLVLQPGDEIKTKSSLASGIDVFTSFMEITE